MATFRGNLEVESDPGSSVVADVEVAEGRITMTASGSPIGEWELNDISIEEENGAFRIIAEDEVLLLHLGDFKRFAGTVGVSIAPRAQEELVPTVSATPAQRAPVDARRIADEPLDMLSSEEEVPGSPPAPHTPGPDESPLARGLSWALAGAAAILFLGAILDWGPVRLTNSNFPIGRLLIVLAGFAAFAAGYLGLALEKRRDVALVAILSGIISVMVIVMYARRAGIGYGFIVTILGAVAVISTSVLALSHLGAPPPES